MINKPEQSGKPGEVQWVSMTASSRSPVMTISADSMAMSVPALCRRSQSADRSRSVDGRGCCRPRVRHRWVKDALSAPWSNEPLVPAEPGSESESTTTLESIASSEDVEMTAIHRADLSAAIQTLPLRERRIIHLRFFEDLTQSDIAGRLGPSQMHVSRLLKASLGEIRLRLERSEGPRSPPREVSLR